MINVGIVGLGTISYIFKQAISKLCHDFCIVAEYDVDVARTQGLLSDMCVARCSSLDEILGMRQVQTVIVLTPVLAHYEVTERSLMAGKDVILEKPPGISINEVRKLYETAEKAGKFLYVAYHASFAVDLQYYVENRCRIEEQYHTGCITRIACEFCDPYLVERNGMQEVAEVSKLGSWLDSGINALSVCERIINLSDWDLISKKTLMCLNNIDVESEYQFGNGGATIDIHTAWNKNINYKATRICYTSGTEILLNHSSQSVCLISNNQRALLFEENTRPRLLNHYCGLLHDYLACIDDVALRRQALEKSLMINRLFLA